MDKSAIKSLRVVFLVLVAATLVLGVGGCGQEPKPEPKPKPKEEAEPGAKFYPKSKPSAVAGQKIYRDNCSACHGVNGAGDGPTASSLPEKPADFTDLKFMRVEEPQEFYENIANGKESMPKFEEKLSAEERWDALFFAWSRATSSMQIAAGRNVYNKNCVVCHGKLGDGKGTAASGLKKKPPRFNDPRWMMKEKGEDFFEVLSNGEEPMPAYKSKLTEEQRWNAIDYIWTFVYTPATE